MGDPQTTTSEKNVLMDNSNSVLRPKQREHQSQQSNRLISSALDPQTPLVLSLYLQLFFNCVLVVSFLYILWLFLRAIQHDISEKTSVQLLRLQQQISNCQNQYSRNFCDDSVPALQQKCSEWASCMSKDPATVGKLKLSAELLAEILNSFIQPISWKSVIFIFIGVFGSLLLNNYIFFSFRQLNSGDAMKT